MQRGLWTVVVVLTMAAGCIDETDPIGGASPLSFFDALDLAEDRVPLQAGLAAAEARVTIEGNKAPSGLAAEWVLFFLTEATSVVYEVSVTASEVRLQEPVVLSDPDEFRVCPPHVGLDSTGIAAAVAETPHWRHVWDTAARREPLDTSWADNDHGSMRIECDHGVAKWAVSTPLMRNADDTVSTRFFLLTLEGVLAAFADERTGGVTYGPSGLGVERGFVPLYIAAGPGSAQGGFRAHGAPRFALQVEPNGWQSLPAPLAKGEVTVTDPQGNSTTIPWSAGPTGRTSVSLVFEPDPLSVVGHWKVVATVEAPWAHGNVMVRWCTGVPTTAYAEEHPECAPLVV